MRWDDSQNAALSAVAAWHEQCLDEMMSNAGKPEAMRKPLSKPVFRLFGWAGTGKTTLAKHLAATLNGNGAVFAAFTGKAALVMRQKGCEGARTIHSLIYTAEVDEETGKVSFILNEGSSLASASLLVVDEVSMVSTALARDILRFDVPVLALGDPFQLPPVEGKDEGETKPGFFTNAEPDHMLTDIHRQSLDNPIVRIATSIRLGEPLRYGAYGQSEIRPVREITAQRVLAADQVLVGKNETRRGYNARIRALLSRDNLLPEPGDRLICLKNDRTMGIFNGSQFVATNVKAPKRGKKNDGLMRVEAQSLDIETDKLFPLKIHRKMFEGGYYDMPWEARRGLQEVDYAYAMTVHKAQGSQWDDVVIKDEGGVFREDSRRWLYTGVTRAANRISIYR